MHIALVHNLRQSSGHDDDQPPSISSQSDTDIYAEWDDIQTITAVADALRREYEVTLVNADNFAFEKLRDLRPDLVFNMAEGLYGAGREAQIPALLDMLAIPYTGSDPVTLGICLDKQRTKEILSWHKIPTPRFYVVENINDLPLRPHYPIIVKPIFEGSSKGITNKSLVFNRHDLKRQVEFVFSTYGEGALLEEFLPGREFTVAMLGNGSSVRVLPVVELDFSVLPQGALPIYSYEAKWIWDQEEDPLQIFTCPAALDPMLEQRITSVCRQAFNVFKCRDWCRIDVRLDAQGMPHIIELNPLPGILPRPEQNSCFPKAARAAGLNYEEMILSVIAEARSRLHLNQEKIYAYSGML
ncbi:ATP-grasp domain-containing protein [Myxococcota bacterium]|nr:ATP-grasp domain-containing protein [Myxococcota bacterium]MBU1533672.1 ATP-grasp domain-containing protein [Myxococcota bacterium]